MDESIRHKRRLYLHHVNTVQTSLFGNNNNKTAQLTKWSLRRLIGNWNALSSEKKIDYDECGMNQIVVQNVDRNGR